MRIERDALGDIEVPSAAWFGGQTVRSLINLSFSDQRLGAYPAYVRSLILVKRAAARANLEAGVLPRRLARAIDAVIRVELADERVPELASHFPVDVLGGGGAIAINMNINEVIANLANEHLGGRRGKYDPIDPKREVNASQSTADVCHTASRLALLTTWPVLATPLAATIDTLESKVREFGETPTLARTCLRDALPTTVGTLLGGHVAALRRRMAELDASIEPLYFVSLGGTVIGDGAGAPAAYRRRVVPLLAQLTGMPLRRRRHVPDALQNSDDLAALSGKLALLSQSLLKLSSDLRLLSSGPAGGFGEVELPYVQQGSSFFAGKSNPVVPETMIQCCLQVLACDYAVQAASGRAELHLNVFDGQAAINVMDQIAMLARALVRFEALCLRGMSVNAARCRALSELVTPSKAERAARAPRPKSGSRRRGSGSR